MAGDNTDQSPLIRLANVGKVYRSGTIALEGASLEVGRGEFLSILGPSGCGKSTILRMIAGLAAPTTGEVWQAWDHQSSSVLSGSQPVSCVFQDPTLLPWASVWENVYLPLRLRGVKRCDARRQVDEIIELVGLADFEDAYPRALSGGMKMRAAGARALVTNPDVLLLDEPFAALDEITRQRLNDDVRLLWKQRRFTTVFITHSVFESVYLSTRVLVMSPRPGRVVDEIVIDLPEDRTADIRTSPEYATICRRVSTAVATAALEAGSPSAIGQGRPR